MDSTGNTAIYNSAIFQNIAYFKFLCLTFENKIAMNYTNLTPLLALLDSRYKIIDINFVHQLLAYLT